MEPAPLTRRVLRLAFQAQSLALLCPILPSCKIVRTRKLNASHYALVTDGTICFVLDLANTGTEANRI